jgi:hypothetical protein
MKYDPSREYVTATFTDADGRAHPVYILGPGELRHFYRVALISNPQRLLTVHSSNLSNTTMPDLLPHRFRESQFRRYETHIAELVKCFPNVVEWTTKLSPITFSCRLRDAMTSLKKNGWKSSLIDIPKFLSIHSQIDVAEHNGKIYSGSTESLKVFFAKPIPANAQPESPTSPTKIQRIVLPDSHSLKALCELLSKKVLLGPFQLDTCNGFSITPDLANALESTFDVAFIIDEGGTIIT